MLKRLQENIKKRADHYLQSPKKTMEEKLPPRTFWLVYFMTLSVLIQGILDLVIKFLGYTPFFVLFPWRVDFLFLTAVSVLMGYQTLKGIERRKISVTRNSIQIGLLVEIALVIGDTIFIIEHQKSIPEAIWVRSPFIFFTLINIAIILYLIKTLQLFKDDKGNLQLF